MIKSIKPRKRLKRVSDKRRKELALYKVASKEYLEEHPMCEWEDTEGDLDGVIFPVACANKSTQIHHKAGRIGKRVYDKSLFMAVCNHHGGSYPHDHPEESYAKKFMLPRWKEY